MKFRVLIYYLPRIKHEIFNVVPFNFKIPGQIADNRKHFGIPYVNAVRHAGVIYPVRRVDCERQQRRVNNYIIPQRGKRDNLQSRFFQCRCYIGEQYPVFVVQLRPCYIQ